MEGRCNFCTLIWSLHVPRPWETRETDTLFSKKKNLTVSLSWVSIAGSTKFKLTSGWRGRRRYLESGGKLQSCPSVFELPWRPEEGSGGFCSCWLVFQVLTHHHIATMWFIFPDLFLPKIKFGKPLEKSNLWCSALFSPRQWARKQVLLTPLPSPLHWRWSSCNYWWPQRNPGEALREDTPRGGPCRPCNVGESAQKGSVCVLSCPVFWALVCCQSGHYVLFVKLVYETWAIICWLWELYLNTWRLWGQYMTLNY